MSRNNVEYAKSGDERKERERERKKEKVKHVLNNIAVHKWYTLF